MISIRECVDPADLIAIRNRHVDFVCVEIDKRIDFYIRLFNYLTFLSHTPLPTEDIIKHNLNQGLHHTQYEPFIKLIFRDSTAFDYNSLNNPALFIPEARNFAIILEKLLKLKKIRKSILELDFSYQSQIKKRYYNSRKLYFQPVKFLLNKIFDYEYWFMKLEPHEPWGPYQLTQKLGLKVCSYCNRQYTFSLSKGKNKITRPELDHFLPKSRNALLALSFYNLIPSCTICNRDCKGKINFSYQTHFSPYEINVKHELLKYDYYPKTYLGSIGETEEIRVFVKNAGVILDPSLKKRIEANAKIFELNSIVNEHKDVVQEIIKKRHMSNDKYIETLQKTFPEAKLTLEEAYRLAYGNFYKESEFNKRPLAKLTKDIAVSIGSLKKFSK